MSKKRVAKQSADDAVRGISRTEFEAFEDKTYGVHGTISSLKEMLRDHYATKADLEKSKSSTLQFWLQAAIGVITAFVATATLIVLKMHFAPTP